MEKEVQALVRELLGLDPNTRRAVKRILEDFDALEARAKAEQKKDPEPRSWGPPKREADYRDGRVKKAAARHLRRVFEHEGGVPISRVDLRDACKLDEEAWKFFGQNSRESYLSFSAGYGASILEEAGLVEDRNGSIRFRGMPSRVG